MQLIPLGVNGLASSYGRQTMSFLVPLEKDALILDAGSGLWRLFEPEFQEMLSGYQDLTIILTHYHSDHVIGLFSLIESWLSDEKRQVYVYAPDPPLVDVKGRKALRTLLSPPFFSIKLCDRMRIINYTADSIAASALLEHIGLRVQARRNVHPGGSVGLRIGDSLAYITDTVADKSVIPFIHGVDLLLHEVWLTDKEAIQYPKEAARHTSVTALANIAAKAGIRRLMPVHHQPKRTPSQVSRIVTDLRKIVSPQIKVLPPFEGRVVNL